MNVRNGSPRQRSPNTQSLNRSCLFQKGGTVYTRQTRLILPIKWQDSSFTSKMILKALCRNDRPHAQSHTTSISLSSTFDRTSLKSSPMNSKAFNTSVLSTHPRSTGTYRFPTAPVHQRQSYHSFSASTRGSTGLNRAVMTQKWDDSVTVSKAK